MWALPPPAVIDPPQATGLVWQPWSEDARRAAQDDGKLVFWISPLIGVSPARPISDLCLKGTGGRDVGKIIG